MGPRTGRVILFGWELGGGLGHIAPLLRVAAALAGRGHRPVFALRNIIDGTGPVRAQGFPVVQAPLWQPRPGGERPFLASNFADILAVQGYDAAEHLLPLIEGWQALLDLVRPSLVVLDFAPTLTLAAAGRLPLVEIGNGFTMPPREGDAFPDLIPGRPPEVPAEQLLAVVREVQNRRGQPAPATLPGLLAAPERFLTVLPELDPYKATRCEIAVGPVSPLLGPPLPPPAEAGFFAYLNGAAVGVEDVLAGLAHCGCPGAAYLRAAAPALKGRLRQRGLAVLDAPPPVEEVLARGGVVVHHGGIGLTHAAFAAGRPQLVFPEHLEQILNGQLLHGLGVGRYLVGRFAPDQPGRELTALLSDRGLAEHCRVAAAGVAARGPWDPLPALVEYCERKLNTDSHRESRDA